MMTYMGSMSYMMSGAGACWEMVYNGNSVARMKTGYAYLLGLRVQLFTTASLMSDLLRSSDALKGVDTNKIKMRLESVWGSHDHAVAAVDQISLLVHQSHI